MTLGEKIKELRESSGLLQRELAHRLNLGEGYLSKVEHDQKPLSRDHLDSLSSIFNEPLHELETLWLVHKLYLIVKDEAQGLEALRATEKQLLYERKRNLS